MEKPSITIEMAGPTGNIFAVVGLATRELKALGRQDEAKEMQGRVFESKSYEEALEAIEEYVEIDRV